MQEVQMGRGDYSIKAMQKIRQRRKKARLKRKAEELRKARKKARR